MASALDYVPTSAKVLGLLVVLILTTLSVTKARIEKKNIYQSKLKFFVFREF